MYRYRLAPFALIICVLLFALSALPLTADTSAVAFTLPPVAVTQSDTPLTLSSQTYDAIVLDGFAASDVLTMTVANGTMGLAQTAGLTFLVGDGSAENTTTLQGSQSAVNLALDGLTITPTVGFAGRITLTLATATTSDTLNIAVNQPIDGEAARDALLDGVNSIHGAVQPGNLAAFGPTAFAINHFDDDNTWVAVSSYGQGRVVAMPDHQALAMDRWAEEGDTATFYKNALGWLNQSGVLTPSIVTYDQGTADWLISQGYTDTVKTDAAGLVAELNPDTSTGSGQADIFIGSLASSQTDANITALQNFALNGGSLFIADYGVGYDWWWNKPYHEIPSNLVLREAGIVFGGGWHWGNGTFDATLRGTDQVNAETIFDMLADDSAFSDQEKAVAGKVMIQLFEGLHPDDPLLARLDDAFTARINSINPTPATPVSDAFEQALLTREAALLQNQDPFEVTIHRTISDTYGMIDPAAPRISRTVGIDTSRTRFQYTGLYVAPGDVVTVTVPTALVGEGYRIRIGTNTDNISPRSDWRRVPYIHRSFAINDAVIPVASAFGGALIIDLGGNNYSEPADVGIQTITVENAVEQPYFVLGTHSNADWLNSLRGKPAVRAALVSTHTIITVPSSYAATLDDPETMMAWWDDVTAGQDELVGRHTPRTAPEIINVDIQNSAGAAHAGYPIQAWDIHWGNPLSSSVMEAGSWGDFHEVGHNHQRTWWTFDGDGEVSVNIFSNFNLETDAANAGSGGWGYSVDEATSIARARGDIAGGGTYSDKSDRWSFWFLLGDVGGWDGYRCAFRSYEDDYLNNSSALPMNNLEEQAQWLVRFSECVGYDMSPFMVDMWGLEVDQASLDAVSHLPDYLPLASEDVAVSVISAEPITIDLAAAAITLDDIATVAAVGQPTNGTLIPASDGNYVFTSTASFTGTATFTYTLQTSVGNRKTFTATVNVIPACGDGLVVTNSADSGPCTLRNALARSEHDDTITFHPVLRGTTLAVSSALMVTRNVTIDGGSSGITLDGQNRTNLFTIGQSRSVHLNNLNILNGRSDVGGVFTQWWSHTVISNTTFASNTSTRYPGGAIHAQGRISTYNSTFSGNHSTGSVGAVHTNGASTFVNSTFVGNSSATASGSVNVGGNAWSIHNSVISSTSGTACGSDAPASSSGNVTFDATCGISNTVVTDFGLNPLTNQNGHWVHLPNDTSPLRSAGDSATCLATDQLGNPRNDSNCDAGAIELQATPTAIQLDSISSLPALRVSLIMLFSAMSLLSVQRFLSHRKK